MSSGTYIRTETSGMSGKHHSKKTKNKIRKALKGNINARGTHHSEETRDKIRKALKGNTNGKGSKGKHYPQKSKTLIGNKYNLGSYRTEETKLKMKKANEGNKNPNWKGGRSLINPIIRFSSEYTLWRKTIFSRDNFTCVKCRQSGGKLNAHHINNFAEFPELRFIAENGITLCKKCHDNFHKKYGKRNNTKEQLEEFLK